MSGPEGRPWKFPLALFAVLTLPLKGFGILCFIELGVRLYAGSSLFSSDGISQMVVFIAVCAVPGGVLVGLKLAGRLELLDALPDPRDKADLPPSRLAIASAGDSSVRPEVVPPEAAPAGRSPEGLLFVFGLAMLGGAAALVVFETESFDAVFGVKLGGVWWRGEYWNLWWFVFYAVAAVGAAATTAAFSLFVRRINRAER